jgi:ABC-type multidrug transport system ATPase subunit
MLRVENVSKIYHPPRGMLRLAVRTASTSPVVALDGIEFEARAGEVVGLVGPNGAGKSTLIRICTSLLLPTTGRVLIDDQDVSSRSSRARASTGLLLTDERALYWRLSGRENLLFFGVMAGLSRAAAAARADELLDRFDLQGRDGRVFGYSSGMRVRLGLARALIAEPKLLILDEPSRSLDPVASSELQEHLRMLASEGTAVVLSSHRLDEVESMCDHVVVMMKGEQRAWIATAELADGAGSVAASLRAMLESGSAP